MHILYSKNSLKTPSIMFVKYRFVRFIIYTKVFYKNNLIYS